MKNITSLKIIITDDGIQPFDRERFSGEILNSDNYKIYILKQGNKFLYVGKTKQAIGKKFGQAFKSFKKANSGEKNSNGYSGYKWIKEFINKGIELDLFVVDLEIDDDNKSEAIEAEMVFLIRDKTGRWPAYQNEIHFHNREATKEIALDIFTEFNR